MNQSEATPSRSAFILAFASIYLVWGSTYLAIRVAVESMQAFLMAGVRFLIAGFALYLFLRLRGASPPTRRQWFDNAVVGTFLLLGGNGLTCLAEQTVPSGITALVIGIIPLFMVLTEWAWPGGHRPTTTTFVGLVLGAAGVAWLAAPWETAADVGVPLRGLSLVLFACFLWSVGSIYSRNVRNPAPLLLGSSMQMLTGGAALFITAGLHGEFTHLGLAALNARAWWGARLPYFRGLTRWFFHLRVATKTQHARPCIHLCVRKSNRGRFSRLVDPP